MKKELIFYTCHSKNPDKNILLFDWDNSGNIEITFQFYNMQKGTQTYKLNYQHKDFENQLKKLFSDTSGYDHLYFGYTSRYLISAIDALYNDIIDDYTFEKKLEEIFQIQKDIAFRNDKMSF